MLWETPYLTRVSGEAPDPARRPCSPSAAQHPCTPIRSVRSGIAGRPGAHRLLERAAPPGHLPNFEPNLRFPTAGGDVESSVQATAEQVTAGQAPSVGDDSPFEVFDDAVAGDARDPYPELALARNAHPVQRLEMSTMPHDQAHPVFIVYRYDDVL